VGAAGAGGGPAAPFTGAGDVLAQLVAADAQRQVAFDVLDRIVAGVGVERVDRIHAVEPAAAAIGALENLHMDPMPAFPHPREGDDLEVADPGGNLTRP